MRFVFIGLISFFISCSAYSETPRDCKNPSFRGCGHIEPGPGYDAECKEIELPAKKFRDLDEILLHVSITPLSLESREASRLPAFLQKDALTKKIKARFEQLYSVCVSPGANGLKKPVRVVDDMRSKDFEKEGVLAVWIDVYAPSEPADLVENGIHIVKFNYYRNNSKYNDFWDLRRDVAIPVQTETDLDRFLSKLGTFGTY